MKSKLSGNLLTLFFLTYLTYWVGIIYDSLLLMKQMFFQICLFIFEIVLMMKITINSIRNIWSIVLDLDNRVFSWNLDLSMDIY